MKKETTHINVLIPEGDTPFTMSVINCLSRVKRYRITVLSHNQHIEARYSKWVHTFAHYQCDSETDYINHLKEVIINHSIQVLLPLHVPSIELITRNRSIFEDLGLKIIAPETEQLNIANDKWLLAEFLRKHELPGPKTSHFHSIEKVSVDFPFVLKPLCGWNGTQIRFIENEEHLKKAQRSGAYNGPVITQEYVPGEDFCVNVICESGQIKAATVQKGILPHSNPFQSHLGVKFIKEPQFLEIISKLIGHLNWTGVANFDIRYDHDLNLFNVIEINPRFWGSLEASESVGVNFADLLCRLSLSEPVSDPSYEEKTYISNRGMLKVLSKKLLFQRTPEISIDRHSLGFALSDPLPKVYKYYLKSLGKMLPRNKGGKHQKGFQIG